MKHIYRGSKQERSRVNSASFQIVYSLCPLCEKAIPHGCVCVCAWACVRNCVSWVSDGSNFEISFLKCVKRIKRRDGAAVLTSKESAAYFFHACIFKLFILCMKN